MQLFRLCRQRYSELSGFGAKKTGGRWNRKGIAALYTAENASLALVEVLVHLDKTEIPEDYMMLTISVPASAVTAIEDSSDERLELFYQEGHRRLESTALGFSVPSIVVPNDHIVVLYPEAATAGKSFEIKSIAPFQFDRRLFLPSTGFLRTDE